MDTTLRLVWFCCGLVWLLRWLGENFWKELQVRCRRTAVFHFNGRCLTSFSFHFTAMDPWTLNWLHVLVLEISHRTPIFLGNLHELQLRFLGGKPDALIGKLHLQILTSGMISNFLKFLSTALRYLWSSPREQLQLERSRLVEDHQLQVERLKKSHSDFWLRWNSEENFKEKLQASRSKILNKDFTLEELRLLYEKKHREEILALERKLRYQLHTVDLRLPRLRDQQQVVLQDSFLRSRLWTSQWQAGIRWGTGWRSQWTTVYFCTSCPSTSSSILFGKAKLSTNFWTENFPWVERLRWCSPYFSLHWNTTQRNFVGLHGDPSIHLKKCTYFRTSSRFVFVYFNNISMPFQGHFNRTFWPGPTSTSASVWPTCLSIRETSFHCSSSMRTTSHTLSSWWTSACHPAVQSTLHFLVWIYFLRRSILTKENFLSNFDFQWF